LLSLGFEVFYDNSERANRIGEEFPKTIAAALKACRVIVAVIGTNWIEHIHRLQAPDDWVRLELRHADPQRQRILIPIHIGTTPDHLITTELPDDLKFIKEINAWKWHSFEDAEKSVLKARLQFLLPLVPPRSQVSASPRLELLCDRIRAENSFASVLRSVGTEHPQTGWLLFGDTKEAHSAMFDRIRAVTLKRTSISAQYPVCSLIKIQLSAYYGSSTHGISEYIFNELQENLGASEIGGYAQLRERLTDKRTDLLLLYSIVTADSAKEARWWLTVFTELLRDIPSGDPDKPRIVWALAISYDEKATGWSILRRRGSACRYFAKRFPAHFDADEFSDTVEAAIDPPFITTRLRSVKRNHVEDWCDHEHVKPYVEGRTELAVAPFETSDVKLPMTVVMTHLRKVIDTTLHVPQ